MPELYNMMMMKALGGGTGVKENFDAGKTLEKGSNVTINGSVKTVADNSEIFNDYENNKAASSFSHAEGSKTGAAGLYSHAEGYQTVAMGTSSHSEGYNSKATGNNSHAEGYGCTSSGIQSHSEGYSNTASGDSSHAEGLGSTASGNHSHAEGSNTIAASLNQHVQGKYNISDSSGKYAFIIGNGSSSKRSNAIAVDWDGKIYVGNSETGIELNDLLSRIEALENA
ncbi:MAG: hypothetical protein IJ666_05455 [Ruminococcus sp.]|nr:hypothetical protein [Ruminococcus sp.]